LLVSISDELLVGNLAYCPFDVLQDQTFGHLEVAMIDIGSRLAADPRPCAKGIDGVV
jgi:hypothetical protein